MGWHAPLKPEAELGEAKKGFNPPFLSLFPFPFFSGEKRQGAPLGETPSRIQTLLGAPPSCSLLPHLYVCGRERLAHPRHYLSRVRHPPPIVYASGHNFIVLRRSPAEITSPSPSPRRRADGTHLLPQHLTGSRRRGTSPRRTCAELGGAVRSILDWWIMKKFRLHQPCCETLPLTVYEGT